MASTAEQEVKVVVIGGGAVGKSSLVVRFISGGFCEEYDPTLEGMKLFIHTDYNYHVQIVHRFVSQTSKCG